MYLTTESQNIIKQKNDRLEGKKWVINSWKFQHSTFKKE